jgi:hypothetical protein
MLRVAIASAINRLISFDTEPSMIGFSAARICIPPPGSIGTGPSDYCCNFVADLMRLGRLQIDWKADARCFSEEPIAQIIVR